MNTCPWCLSSKDVEWCSVNSVTSLQILCSHANPWRNPASGGANGECWTWLQFKGKPPQPLSSGYTRTHMHTPVSESEPLTAGICEKPRKIAFVLRFDPLSSSFRCSLELTVHALMVKLTCGAASTGSSCLLPFFFFFMLLLVYLNQIAHWHCHEAWWSGQLMSFHSSYGCKCHFHGDLTGGLFTEICPFNVKRALWIH